jgi:flagellar basal-body rod modification protein FlgD
MQVSPTGATAMTTAANGSSATSSQQAQAAATAAAPNVNYNQFLQLLLTEMKNQDPTQPMDPTTSISQIATFSQVEQQIQTNSKLDAMLTSSALSQADSVIGRTVTSADGKLHGQIASVTVSSSGATANLADGSRVQLTSGVTIS